MFAVTPAKCGALIALICAVCVYGSSATGLSCIDENGKPVDWYMGYKFPKIKGDKRFETGHAYAYITSEDVSEPVNDDIQLSRPVDDHDSLIFLRSFKDLLVKFGGLFTKKSAKSIGRTARGKKAKAAAANSNQERWRASEKLISDPDSFVMRTLAPAYDHALFSKISSVYYNDDPEDTDADGREDSDDEENEENGTTHKWTKKNIPSRVAHAKGAFLMDEASNTGVWLTHSVPKFPNVREHFLDYPDTGTKFGQTFMCITIDLEKSGGKLIDHLINMKPLVYDRHVTDSLLKKFPNLQDLDLYRNSRYKRQTNAALLGQTITTKGGQVMKLFSKPASVKEDLWGGWIDHDIGTDLYVETWRRGSGGVLDSSCPKTDYHVNNVKDLKYSDTLKWEYLSDHSKWAVSDEKEVATVCIGDSNRMESQFKRGSGAICIRCPTCWATFYNTIADTEPCPLKVTKGVRRELTVDKSLATRVGEYLS